MKLSLPSFAGWRSGALAAFTRFPWNILCGATGAACLITLIHTEHDEWLEGQCVRLAMAAAIGMPLFPCTSCVNEFRNSLHGLSKLSACLFWQDGFLPNRLRRCAYRESSGFNGCSFWRHCTASLPCPRISRVARAWASGNLTGVYLSGFVSPPFTRLS